MRHSLKVIISVLATLLVLPAFLLYQLGRVVLGAEYAFPGWSQAFALVPGLTGILLRRAFYRLVLPRCGNDAWIGFGTLLSHPTAEIGRGVYVGPYCSLGDVTLGDDVLLASHVSVTNGGSQHGIERLDLPIRDQSGSWPRVRIGCDSWIGERAVVMADVGDHGVIGAGAVVTRSIPDLAIAVGVPAHVVRYRDGQMSKTKECQDGPWNHDTDRPQGEVTITADWQELGNRQ